MSRHLSRTWSVALALVGTVWAFLLLPPQQAEWSGADAPRWLQALDALPMYDQAREALRAAGTADFYLVFGAASALSFVLIWLATLAAFAAAGWSGRVLGALVLIGAPLTFVSYLSHAEAAPLHALWGAEAFVLMAVGVWAVVVAIAAPRGRIPVWERVLIGLTPAVVVASTLTLSYWPHGTLVGLGLEAAAIAAFGARPDAPPHAPADAIEHREDRVDDAAV